MGMIRRPLVHLLIASGSTVHKLCRKPCRQSFLPAHSVQHLGQKNGDGHEVGRLVLLS